MRHPDVMSTQEDTDYDVTQRDRFCRKVTKFVLVQFILGVIIVLYWIGGAFMFQYLELTNEKAECKEALNSYLAVENKSLASLLEIAKYYKLAADEPYAKVQYYKELTRLRDRVLELGYDGRNCSSMGEDSGPSYQWSLSGSFLFTATVFTTIGYGNIAPKTDWGRICCICYALMGIPLMLICLNNIGRLLGSVFRFVYTHLCLLQCFRPLRRRKNSDDFILSSDFMQLWKAREEKLQRKPFGSPFLVHDDNDNDDDNDDNGVKDDTEGINSPITVALTVMVSYLFLGSLMFGAWVEWDWMTSAYYCFITLSTIGFGDLVPGSLATDLTTNIDSQLKMCGACAYILIGMSLMSMCLDLIQQEMADKMQWLTEMCPACRGHEAKDQVTIVTALRSGSNKVEYNTEQLEHYKAIQAYRRKGRQTHFLFGKKSDE